MPGERAPTSFIPAIGWLRGYRGEWLRADVMAGLIAAAVVIPKAMAHATIAGLPVQVGLFTALAPMIVYALLGTSRPLSVSTTTTIAILTGAELARTQLAELVTAAMALATLLLLAPVIAMMPNAVLAAVVVVYSMGLIEPSEFREIARVRATEFYWALIAFGGVVLLGTLRGIIVAIIASLLALAYQAYDPAVYPLGRKRGTDVFRRPSPEHADDETWPGLLIVRAEGRMFFANAQIVGDKIWQLVRQQRPSVVVLDCSAVTDLEITALNMLIATEENQRRNGVSLWLAALNPAVLAIVQRSSLGEHLGRERMFFTVSGAVEKFCAGAAGAAAAPVRQSVSV